MKYREYNSEKDKKAVHLIWYECGWLEQDNPKPMDTMIDSGRTIVVDINGEPECLAVSSLGNIDYAGEKLPLSIVTAVTTSLVARKQGLAGRLTAAKVALDAQDGAAVCGLGIFEQGYYDKLGFGIGGYEHIVHFLPSSLKVDAEFRVPVRISKDDWEQVHQSRLNRLRVHGSCNLDAPELTKAEMEWAKTGFGFGYRNESGELTHHLWMSGKGKEQGPFRVNWMVFQNYDQFLELMALLRSFGEQVLSVVLDEPPHIQIQDFLIKPFHYQAISKKSEFENIIRALAYWQMRICDLEKCLEKTHLKGETVSFNLSLHDPIEKYLDESFKWGGISGDYIITLGPDSKAEKGSNENLPNLKAEVGAFTRMWLGVLPASILAVSDELSAPDTLLKALDNLIRLPKPTPNWTF